MKKTLSIAVLLISAAGWAGAQDAPAAVVDLDQIFRKQRNTALTVTGQSGAVYHMSGQPKRMESGEKSAFLVFHKDGMEPAAFEIPELQKKIGFFCTLGLKSLPVGSDTLYACITDGKIREAEQMKTELSVGLAGKDYQLSFTIEKLFQSGADAAYPVTLAGKTFKVGYIDDFPLSSGLRSVMIYHRDLGPHGMMTIPLEMIQRVGGWLVDLGGAGVYNLKVENGRLEFHNRKPVAAPPPVPNPKDAW